MIRLLLRKILIRKRWHNLKNSTFIWFRFRNFSKISEIQDYLKAGPSTLMSSFSSLTSLIQIFSFLSSNILLKKRVRILWVTAEFLHYFSPSRFDMNQFLASCDWLSEISHWERCALIGQIDLREKWIDLWLSHPFSVSENKNEILENLEKILTQRDQLKLCQRPRLRTTPSGESSPPWLTLRIPE